MEYDDGDEGYCDYLKGIERLINAEDVGCKAETTTVLQKRRAGGSSGNQTDPVIETCKNR